MSTMHGRHTTPTPIGDPQRDPQRDPRRNMRRGTKRVTIALATILTVAGAASAFAYWTSVGSGTGEATTGVSTALVITTNAAVGEIAPGNAGETIGFTVTNPSDGALTLSAVAVTLADATGTAWVPPSGCLIADFTVSVTTAPTYGDIAAGGFVTGTVTVTLTNTGVNQDACQGLTVPVYFAAS